MSLRDHGLAPRDLATGAVLLMLAGHTDAEDYRGRWIEGTGDAVTLEAIDAAYESLQPSPRMACLPLLYKRDWDGFVEGPPWPAWWIQNSFGPSYAMMPFLGEPYATWLEHSQALWFRLMGDGQRKDVNGFQGPDGCLCDAAFAMMNGGSDRGFGDMRRPGGAVGQQHDGSVHSEGIWYRQGDGNPSQHDWFMGATAGGLILESERLLIRHDPAAAKRRLPELQRVAAFLDSRRDPERNLLKGAMAANLLAPSYSGIRLPDGTFGPAYLTELSVNYVAGLERLAEVCVLCGEPGKADGYRATAAKVRGALPRLMTPEGCFFMSEDPDGTRHGVYGAAKHGYFEATPNHDAGCFGVTDDAANERIIRAMLALKGQAPPGGLAPHGLIIPNYPGYDDSVHGGGYGHWVNGGHWTTTQGRMSIACLRANEFAHPVGAWARIRTLMEGYRADAPLTGFGLAPWGDKQQAPYCVVYDCWGAPGGLLRGLFEYDYRADRLRVRPHLPPAIVRFVQKFPVWFGRTRIYLTVTGAGIGAWTDLRPDGKPGTMAVELVRGDAKPLGAWQPPPDRPLALPDDAATWEEQADAWPQPISGNDNPLRIGESPGGGYVFDGEFREVRIYRKPMNESEIAALAKGDAVPGAMIGPETASNAPPQLAARRGKVKFWEYPPSVDIDFQEDFTLAASIRPAALADSARLIDRTTIGTMNGYLLDYVSGGRVLRMITPWGVVQGAAVLQTGKWQHVASSCSTSGLMRVYLDGVQVAEAQGVKPPPVPASSGQGRVDLAKVAAFYRELCAAGAQDTYEAAQARAALELFLARRERLRTPPTLPKLDGIRACDPTAVDKLYLNTAQWIAGGLLDHLSGRSLWRDPVAPAILKIASRTGLLPESAVLRELPAAYTQCLMAENLPVVGSAKVSPYALREAAYLIRQEIGHRPDILHAMASNRVRFVVMAATEMTTDVPEHSDLEPAAYWNRRARGLGATDARPAVSCGEENLLCLRDDPYGTENILIHEFAHAIHERGLNSLDPTFDQRLRVAYDHAGSNGLWRGTYAMQNRMEYWAEGTQSWFDTNRANDNEHGPVDTREKLKAHDPDLAVLLAEVYGDRPWRYVRPAARPETERAHLAGFDAAACPSFRWPAEAPPLNQRAERLAWLPPGLIPAASPRRGGAETTIHFVNQGSNEVSVSWVDFEGVRRPYGAVRPGRNQTLSTFPGHVWVISERGADVGAVAATERAGRVDINTKGKQL